jgi:hypothetical protein
MRDNHLDARTRIIAKGKEPGFKVSWFQSFEADAGSSLKPFNAESLRRSPSADA